MALLEPANLETQRQKVRVSGLLANRSMGKSRQVVGRDPSKFFLRSSRIRVDLLPYEGNRLKNI